MSDDTTPEETPEIIPTEQYGYAGDAKFLEVVPVDPFEREMLREVSANTPGLTELREAADMSTLHPDELLQDLNALFWKADPEVRTQGEISTGATINRIVVEAINNSPDTEELRKHTTYDKYATALATMSVGETVIDVMGQYKERLDKIQQDILDWTDVKIREIINDPNVQGYVWKVGDPLPDKPDELVINIAPVGGGGDPLPIKLPPLPPEILQQLQELQNDAGAAVATAVQETIARQAQDLKDEEEAARAWGHEDGVLKRMSYAERKALTARFKQSRMWEFRKIMGKFQLEAKASKVVKSEHGRDEIYNVTMGNELGDVIPSEFSAMGNPALQADFMRRFAEGQLVSNKWRGKQHAGDGPILCLIDCSGSMEIAHNGVTREAWAKAFALSLMEVADNDNRAFTTILFSSARQQIRIDGTDIESRFQMAENFFGGGTNFDVPLTQALEIIAHEKDHEKSDILIITDGECGVSEPVFEQIEEAKAKGLRIFGICIGYHGGQVMERLSDNLRSIDDLTDTGTVTDIYQMM